MNNITVNLTCSSIRKMQNNNSKMIKRNKSFGEICKYNFSRVVTDDLKIDFDNQKFLNEQVANSYKTNPDCPIVKKMLVNSFKSTRKLAYKKDELFKKLYYRLMSKLDNEASDNSFSLDKLRLLEVQSKELRFACHHMTEEYKSILESFVEEPINCIEECK